MDSSPVIPKWLDERFIETALRAGEENDAIKVKKIDVRPAIAPGENFFSALFRASVDYSRNNASDGSSCTKSLIVKVVPEVDLVKMILAENDAFATETEVLRKLIPSFHRLLNIPSAEETVKLGPVCYYYTGKPDSKIVLEDLCESGFKLAEKTAGLNLDHSKMAVSHFGKFHAASVALNREDQHSFDNFRKYPNLKNRDMMGMMIKQSFDSVASNLQALPGIGTKYPEKLRRLGSNVIRCIENAVQRDDEGFNVLNHGDAWINNMMFRYSEYGNLLDMTFLDFQACYYGSPAIDLQYFLYSTPSSEVRRNHFDELLECYHSSLSKTLTKLGCSDKCPTLDDIRREIEKRNFISILSTICLMSLRFFKASDMPELKAALDDISTSESFDMSKLEMFKKAAEPYIKEVLRLLSIFDEKGWLDQ